MANSGTFDKTNRGTLRKNDKKQEDWHPDYRGDVNVEGTDYWLDATLKQWPDGTRYMSLKIRRKEPRSDAPRSAPAQDAPRARTVAGRGSASTAPALRDDLDDSLPF